MYDGALPQVFGSMKEQFLRLFFKDGKYKPMAYDEHLAKVKQGDSAELLRGLMVDAVQALHKYGNIANGKVTSLHEVKFLKG